MARNKYIITPGILVYINSKPFAVCTGFEWTSATNKKPISGIDQTMPSELAPTTTQIQGTISLLRTHGDGGLEGQGLAARPEDLPREKYFTITVIDKINNKILFQANYCSVVSQSWSMPERSIVKGRLSFMAITFGNEAA